MFCDQSKLYFLKSRLKKSCNIINKKRKYLDSLIIGVKNVYINAEITNKVVAKQSQEEMIIQNIFRCHILTKYII